MDAIDLRILSQLQKNSQISMARLAEEVGLSLSACHRRVKILEQNGKIRGYAARLDRKALGLEFQVFLEVKLISQRREDILQFEDHIRQMPEILECYLISGDFDYLMRVASKNTESYETLYRDKLGSLPGVSQIRTLFSLSTVKFFEGFHLEGLET